MDLGIAGKVALVTGASLGIGRAVAEGLAAEGVRVALSARDASRLDAAVEAIRLRGGEAFGVPADMADPRQIERLVAAVEERVGPPEIVLVNAGGPPPGAPTDLDEDAWARGYDLTLMSAVRLVRAVLPAMRRAGWGRIVHITSLTVKEPLLQLTLSNAFRAGVTGFAKTLALEVATDGITVNCVAPGYIATDRLEQLLPDDAARDAVLGRIPMGRFGAPEEVAAVAVFLASLQAAYVTGQTIVPEGGAVAAIL
jgi:3-oxoacyl-[acyl-carrier protein] reductase